MKFNNELKKKIELKNVEKNDYFYINRNVIYLLH